MCLWKVSRPAFEPIHLKRSAMWPADLTLSWAKSICMHYEKLFNISIASEGAAVQKQFTLLTYQTSFFKENAHWETFSSALLVCFSSISSVPNLTLTTSYILLLSSWQIRKMREEEEAEFYKCFWSQQTNQSANGTCSFLVFVFSVPIFSVLSPICSYLFTW